MIEISQDTIDDVHEVLGVLSDGIAGDLEVQDTIAKVRESLPQPSWFSTDDEPRKGERSAHQIAYSILQDHLISEDECNSVDFEVIYGRKTLMELLEEIERRVSSYEVLPWQ